jgi:chemotaxis protein CheD
MMPATLDGVTTLHPGDVVLGLRGDRLQTLLGSCVAVVLTDPGAPWA